VFDDFFDIGCLQLLLLTEVADDAAAVALFCFAAGFTMGFV
jgi:hypothetical protein